MERDEKERGETGGSLKVCDERLQQYFQLPWKLFTAHKLPGRNTSLSPSHHPSDRPPSCPNEAGLFCLFFWKKKERKWNGLLFHSFILLLSFSCFCTVFFSFLGGGRFITVEESNSKTQTQKVEDDLSPPSAPLSSSFLFPSSSLVPLVLWKERKTERGGKWGRRRGWRETNRGEVLFGNVVKWAQM